MEVQGYFALLVAITLGVAGQLCLKHGLLRHEGIQPVGLLSAVSSGPVITGFTCYGISVLFYLKALGSLDLSVTYPSVSLGYALVVVLSKVLFKETISLQRWMAVIIICGGVALVGLGAR